MQDTPHLPSGFSKTVGAEGGGGGVMGRDRNCCTTKRWYLDGRMSKVLSAQRRSPNLSMESSQGRLPGGRRHT